MFLYRVSILALILAFSGFSQTRAEDALKLTAPPKVGEEAPDFTLESLEGNKVILSEVAKKSPVVLVVLRGYPGYQCPICSRQVGGLLQEKTALKDAGAHVLFIYPGPSENLQTRAKEFVKQKVFPDQFTMLLDPDYKFTNAYQLRWDAKRETAYPSTFVLDKTRKVQFAKISKTHGGRTKPAEILSALKKLK